MIAALPRLHAVTDDRVIGPRGGRVVERAAVMASAAGPLLAVHLRARQLPGGAFLAMARELAAVLAPHGSWLVVNDRADVARAARARAVVAGRGGLPVSDVRRVAPGVPVGRSVHDAAEVEGAMAEGADFLVAGAVYATASHPGDPARGPEVVRRAAATGLPVIAIGGLTPDRVADVVRAGAFGVAAIRALWDAADPAAAAAAFLAALPARGDIGVVINGEARRARQGISLLELLADLDLDARAVVVEHNRRIVRRDALAATPLAEGDAVELVHFVGGG